VISSRLPRRAPKLLLGIARSLSEQLSPQGCRELAKGQEAPFANPQQKLWSAGFKRRSGGLSFGYFSLPKQRKVTRLSVRPIGRIADWHLPFRAKTGMFFVKPTLKISLATRIL
jgi:hypothetical protein